MATKKKTPKKSPNSTYNVFYVPLTEKRIVVSAPNKAKAQAIAKKKLGKVKITEVKLKNMYF
jgi:hypothetical protein